jgi:hypothetical protein
MQGNMLQAILDTIFSAGTLFGVFFILLGIVVFLKTIEKLWLMWYQFKHRSQRKHVRVHE